MPPPQSQGIVLFALSVLPLIAIVAAVRRGGLQRLDGAFYLLLWGLLIAVAEHVGFGRMEFGGSRLVTHEGFHFQMLAAYGLAAFALTAAVVGPLIRRGEKIGWYGLLILTVVGVGAEAATAFITTPHGVAPRWWSWGLALWAYPLAWGTALILSRRAIFETDAG